MQKYVFVVLIMFMALSVSACSPNSPQEQPTSAKDTSPGSVNIYTSRHYDTDLAIYSEFTEATGIVVNTIEAKADALIARIEAEGEHSQADVLITVDAGRLFRAEQAGILSPIDSDVLTQRIPEYFRHPDGLWFGISKRARVIIYNKAFGRPAGLSGYMDLAKPELQGQVCMRSSSNIYNISLLSSMIGHYGSEKAQNWANGVVANFARKPQSNDTGNFKDVASGQCKISMVNTYYLARQAGVKSANGQYLLDQIGIIFPDQTEKGTHINISGAGLVAHAPNRQNAIRFIEYLTSERAQSYFANGNNEYPIIADIAPNAAVTNLGEFEMDMININQLGIHQKQAVQLFDKAGWQ